MKTTKMFSSRSVDRESGEGRVQSPSQAQHSISGPRREARTGRVARLSREQEVTRRAHVDAESGAGPTAGRPGGGGLQ